MSKLDEVSGKITDIKEFDNTLYISVENKVYEYDSRGLKEVLTSDKNIKAITMIGYEAFILQNDDDTYSVYVNTIYMENDYKEIKGIDFSNVIYVMYNKTDSVLNLFKLEQEQYYVEVLLVDYELNIQSQEAKKTLGIKLTEGVDSRNVRDIKQIFVVNSTDMLVVLKNGEVYTAGTTMFSKDLDNFYIHGKDDLKLEDVEKIYTINKYDPVFEKISDRENLYTYENSILISSGKPNKEDMIKIPLTEGYKTSDIKNVFASRDIVIEYNDKSIFQASSYALRELGRNDKITKLNQENKIKRITGKSFEFCILLDDKNLYEFNI